MKIIDTLKGIGVHTNDVKQLNKSLEMMTIDELKNELELGLKESIKTGKLDNRTKQIVEFLLPFLPRLVENILFEVKSKEIIPELLKHFSKYLDDEMLNYLMVSMNSLSNIENDKEAQKEARLNKLKAVCNRVTSRVFKNRIKNGKMEKNALHLKLKNDESNRMREERTKLRDEAYEVLFLENYDRIEWRTFIRHANFDVIKNIYNKLPTQIKNELIFLWFLEENVGWISEEELKKILLENEDIKYKFFEYMKNGEYEIRMLGQIIGITSEDIQKYYRSTGIYPNLGYMFSNELNTAEEYIKDLKCIKEEYRDNFINGTLLPFEEEIKLIDLNEIDDIFKMRICMRMKGYPEYKGREKYYYTKIMENTESEITKNDCNIAVAALDGEYAKILQIIKTGKYTFETLISYCDFLKFSDEEIKELYSMTEDEGLKGYLLSLRRGSLDWEDRETDNKNKDNYKIIINKENYIELLKKARSDKEMIYILYDRCLFDFSLEQNLEIFGIVRERNVIKEEEINKIVGDISSQMTLELFPRIIELGVFENENIQQLAKRIVKLFNLDNVEECINIIVNLDNVELKRELLDRIIEEYSYSRRDIANLDKILDMWLDKENVSIEDKYLLLSKNMKLNLRYSGKYDEKRMKEFDKEFYERFSSRFRKLNEESKMEEYSEILDFKPEYDTIEGITYNTSAVYNITDCVQYLSSETVYDKMKKIYSKNKNVKNNIHPTLLNDEVISKLDDDSFEFLSRYKNNAGSLQKVLGDGMKCKVFVSVYKRMGNIKTFFEEDILEIASFIERLTDKELAAISEQDIDLIIAIALSKDMYSEFSGISVKDNESRLEKYVETIKSESYKKIHDVHCTKKQAINAIGMRFFGLSYVQIKELVDKYASDVEEFIKYYKEKSELTEEEKNELEALIIVRNFKEILSINDENALLEVFDELEKLEEFNNIDFSLSIVLDENIRRAFAKEYKENLYQLNENDRIESVDGIAVYSPKEFSLLVHVVAAYGNFKLIDEENPEKSAKENYNNAKDKKNHIVCTSYINNSHLCYAKPKKKDKGRVILGFAKFGDNSLLMASPIDIASDTTAMQGDRAATLPCFMMSKNMVNNTRWQHNEVDLERRLEDEKGSNIQPDYIVCVDRINDESKRIAKDFGIPIIFLDTREIAKNESKKLEELFEKFYQSMEPNIIEEIINLYHTNINSFFQYNQKLIKKYFSPSKMNENLQKIMNRIDEEYKMGDRKKAIKCYEVLNKALNNEININMKVGLEAEKEVKGEKVNLREYRHLTGEKIKRIKKENRDFDTYRSNENIGSNENIRSNSEDRVFSVVSRVKERSSGNDR